MILGRYTYRLPTLKKITRRACLKQIAWGTAAALPAFLWAGQVPARDFALQPTPTAGQNASMAGIARRFMDRYAVPGLSVAIARHGQFVYAEGFGFADRTAGERVTPSHLFRIASAANLGYASGWSVNAARNWWHVGSLPGQRPFWCAPPAGYVGPPSPIPAPMASTSPSTKQCGIWFEPFLHGGHDGAFPELSLERVRGPLTKRKISYVSERNCQVEIFIPR
jgi:hypothetical protein